MLRIFHFLAIAGVLLATLALSIAAGAQREGDRGQRPDGPPGGGPPGGGPPPGGPGMFGGPGGGALSGQYGRLLNSPTVQKELGLTEAQQTKLKEVSEKSRAGMREMFSGMRGLNEEQSRAKWEELGKKMQTRLEESTKSIEAILQPNQFQRLRGIALQMAGAQAFSDTQLQKDLKLSEDQILEIGLINENTSKQMRGLFPAPGRRGQGGDRGEGGDRGQRGERRDFEAMRTKIDEIRKSAEKEILDELTAEQKASLEQLKGAKIEIPMSELRPSRPGGRGGPPLGGPPPDDGGGRRRGGSDDRP
jgi:Spy/CpxP family protein refolding chaperone